MFEVSVVVPVKYPAPYLNACIESIMKQTYLPKEVILVETGDGTFTRTEVNSVVQIRQLRQTGKGLAQAWNQGITNAKGSHVAFIDSDDEWDIDCLKNHEAASRESDYMGGSIGKVIFSPVGEVPSGFRKSLLGECHLAYMPGCSVLSQEALKGIGNFREDLGVTTDIEWFGRARGKLSFVEMKTTVLVKRVHTANLSYNALETGTYQQDLTRALFALIKAKRQT